MNATLAPLAPMTDDAAGWVYDIVLTQRYKESAGAIMWTGKGANRRDEGEGRAFIACCECQYGPCGRCSDGRHERCTHHHWRPTPGPATHVVNQRGYALNAVWMSGKACVWRCSCGCPAPKPVVEVAAAPEPVFEQLDLFALAGAP